VSDAAEPAVERPGHLFRSWKEPLIAGLVALHFLLGLAAAVPEPSLLWRIGPYRFAAATWARFHLDQRWNMFSPPPRAKQSLYYALHYPEGWTPLISLDGFAADRVKRSILQPRGAFRLMVQLRSINADSVPAGLSQKSFRAFYYQQLADFFCRGAGAAPGIISVRFYLVGKTPPHFFTRDRYGRPLDPPADYDFREPLYEQECSPP
jgi:hypothetical protein